MKPKYSLVIGLMLASLFSFSQMVLNRDTSLTFLENGQEFSSPLSGGINAGQFSNIDLNLDGVMDIVVFDKSGNKLSPFINDNGDFIYTPKYRTNFPNLHDWVLLVDYNCDGKNDIFTYSSGGMAVYLNTSTTELEFTLITPLVLSDYGSNNLNIYISPVDIPAIADIDYDGDLDVLTFSILGGFVEYHKNMSMELYGNCDSLVYEFSESCWGLFYEGLNSYILNCPSCICPQITNTTPTNAKQKHAGSTLLAIDVDNDNDKDLVLGDISYNNLNLLINGGDNQNAIMTAVDSVFPQNYSNTLAAEMHVYPASYYIDVTNDGVKDLIVTTNSENNSENFESCWLYENTGQNTSPDFNFIQKDFLQENMIELGTSAFPTFYDYNTDGLLDLVIGNYGYHNPNNDPASSLALFENIGNDSIPKYNLINRDWLGLSTINLNTTLNIPALNLSPTFSDLDGDGNKDLIVGDADGKVHFFTNNGGNFQITNPNYQNIDVGQFAQPQIIDVNRDGLNDLIIGEQDGTINYLPNSGTTTNAIFDTIITNWGGVDVDQSYISTGFSNPTLYDSSGVYQLFVGSFSGNIYQFTNIDNNLNGQFTAVNSTSSNIWDGGKSALALADINNDNNPDMIVGNLSGGISFFSSDTLLTDTTITNVSNQTKNIDFTIYPNPAKTNFTIKSSETGTVTIKNLLGNTIYNKKKTEDILKINISQFSKGIYVVLFKGLNKKLVVE
ncbi:MAG: FG-GAP-like repeat-containing protein [Flavobacteriales bacterium]|nr:FG-GAP-like repeat-containing protein [Flavobacteriales bacterium]